LVFWVCAGARPLARRQRDRPGGRFKIALAEGNPLPRAPLGARLCRLRLDRALTVLIAASILAPLVVAPRTASGADFANVNPSEWPSRDWRSPGFVAIVDGQMYDPDCWPLQSIGANVPNLMYRQSTIQNLEWMRQNKVRWIRVFVTGHRETHKITADIAEQRLRELVGLVEAYNRAVGPNEAIYLMMVLTDYYGRGVPGDQYVRDNPHGCEHVVLPAPWYRRGQQYFDFKPECGDETATGMPNYEVNFKPWVRRMVGSVAESPAILGWQLGNELKSRVSPRNNVGDEEAFEWYLAFVNDIVDTIREADPNHLIITGSQYFAELADLPYRPLGHEFEPELRDVYVRDLDRMMLSCGRNCWNIWNLTYYDFHPYSIDDAMLLARGRVATIYTEYGFTLGTPAENRSRFGGDRVAALRSGIDRPWQDIFGFWYDDHWSLAEAIRELSVVGAAAWGSPNPDVQTDPGSDLDRRRGISNAPEGLGLWREWSNVAKQLELANARFGESRDCKQLNSTGRKEPRREEARYALRDSEIRKPRPAPEPPMQHSGTIVGISTDFEEPTLVLGTGRREILIRMPKTQIVKTYNLGDRVRAKGWPMGEDVMLSTVVEPLRR
jgi:hypothetical protein